MLALLPLLALAAPDPAVQAHLLEAVSTLRAETPASLAADVRAHRLQLLGELELYALRGEFPGHRTPPRIEPRRVLPPRAFSPPDAAMRAPLFVDDDGVPCAVGYLLGLERPDLVARIVAGQNHRYLPEMEVDGLADWAAQAGFTLDELAWIQPQYREALATCDAFVVRGDAPSPRKACAPHDVSIGANTRLACQECGGDLQIWAAVDNAGDAVTGEVILGDVDEQWRCLDRLRVELPARTVTWVGPLRQPSWRLLNEASLGVYVQVPDNCWSRAWSNVERPFDVSAVDGPACEADAPPATPVVRASCAGVDGGSGGGGGSGGSGGGGAHGGAGGSGGADGGSGTPGGSGGSIAGGSVGSPAPGGSGGAGPVRVPDRPRSGPVSGCTLGGGEATALGLLLLAFLRRAPPLRGTRRRGSSSDPRSR